MKTTNESIYAQQSEMEIYLISSQLLVVFWFFVIS